MYLQTFSVAFFKLWQKKEAKEKAKTDDFKEAVDDTAPKQPMRHCKCCEDHQWHVLKNIARKAKLEEEAKMKIEVKKSFNIEVKINFNK